MAKQNKKCRSDRFQRRFYSDGLISIQRKLQI